MRSIRRLKNASRIAAMTRQAPRRRRSSLNQTDSRSHPEHVAVDKSDAVELGLRWSHPVNQRWPSQVLELGARWRCTRFFIFSQPAINRICSSEGFRHKIFGQDSQDSHQGLRHLIIFNKVGTCVEKTHPDRNDSFAQPTDTPRPLAAASALPDTGHAPNGRTWAQ